MNDAVISLLREILHLRSKYGREVFGELLAILKDREVSSTVSALVESDSLNYKYSIYNDELMTANTKKRLYNKDKNSKDIYKLEKKISAMSSSVNKSKRRVAELVAVILEKNLSIPNRALINIFDQRDRDRVADLSRTSKIRILDYILNNATEDDIQNLEKAVDFALSNVSETSGLAGWAKIIVKSD